MNAQRPLYWSVWRELWENRSVYIAPLMVSGVVAFGFVMSTVGLAARRRALLKLDLAQQRFAIERPYDIAATMLVFTAFIVAIFYCLDALHGERRDRSVLFWKSLPVSDLTTVISKAVIPIVILPAVIFMTIVTVQLAMLTWSNVVLMAHGVPPTTYAQYPFFEQSFILLYGLVVLALWHAPVYAWMLVVSSWARRATFLWAFLPFLAIAMMERIAFNTQYFGRFLRWRFIEGITTAFVFEPKRGIESLSQLTPGRFLTTPGLWLGLVFAALLLTAAARIRRYRDPI